MQRLPRISPAIHALAATALLLPWQLGAQEVAKPPMGFFITSIGIGNGGNLGGLAGADRHCQTLADAAGVGQRTWRAYLSTQAVGNTPAVNARDRIGTGPWHNAAGLLIAANVESLHYDNSNLTYDHALNERGERVNSGVKGDSPNMHDILTGTKLDGTAFPPGDDRTCSNWTSSTTGAAFVGHHDRYTRSTPGSPWNSVHATPGCGQNNLVSTGGAGLFYCFAIS